MLSRRSRVRAGAVAAVLATLAAGSPAVATQPTGDRPVIPSQAEVSGAKKAAAAAAAEVATLTTQQQAAEAQLAALQLEVSRAVAADQAAQDALALADAVATKAAEQLAATRARQQAARRAVSSEAALMWTHSGSTLANLDLVLTASPESASDLQVVLEGNSQRAAHALDAAASAASAARAQQAYLDAALRDQAAAAATARAARAAAQSAADSAGAKAAALATQLQSLSSRLDSLRARASALATQRTQGLAALARAEAEARARAAAAAKAARERAAREAASTPVIGGGSVSGGGAGLSPSQAQSAARSMMGAYGWDTGSQFSCLVNLWNGESGWSWSATNPSSGAYGIPQSLPAWKMASAGSDWLTNAVTQVRWGMGYIKSSYGTPCSAWGTWLSRSPHWY